MPVPGKTFSILVPVLFLNDDPVLEPSKTFSILEPEPLLPLYINVKREEASEASCERSELIHRNDRI